MAAGGEPRAHVDEVRLVLVITALSVAHHVDHVVRDVTGWAA